MATSKINTGIETIANGSVNPSKYKMILLLLKDKVINGQEYLVPFRGQGAYFALNGAGDAYCVAGFFSINNGTISCSDWVYYSLNASGSKASATAPDITAIYGIR